MPIRSFQQLQYEATWLGPKRIAIAAYADNKFVEQPVYPCGSCRQVLLEHENRVKQPVEIIMYGSKAITVVKSIVDLLPLPFDYKLTP